MNGLKRVASKAVALTPGKPAAQGPAAPETTATRSPDAMELQPRGALTTVLASAIAKLIPQPFEPLVGPPAGKPIKATGSLIGLGGDVVDPKASYEQNLAALKAGGIPRFPLLTPVERRHEAAFANDVERDVEHFVAGVELLANDEELGTMVFEPDGVKRLYAPYGTDGVPSSDAERKVRAEANHALHPAATVVARLAFLKRLDALQRLPEGDPKRTIFATAGGCAAGKGDMDETVKLQFGGFPFGAMWDSAGESDGLDNAWVLEAAQARGLKGVFAFAANEAEGNYQQVLNRGIRTGRFVDVVTFASSYVEGTKNMRAFLGSPAYRQAAAAGVATTLAMHMGAYDRRAETDPSLPHYPHAKVLGDGGVVGPGDLPSTPDTASLVAAAVSSLASTVKQVRAGGGDVDGLLLGALGNAEKFSRSGVLERV